MPDAIRAGETNRLRPGAELRAVLTGLCAVALACIGLRIFPAAEVELFGRGTGGLVALLTGRPIARAEDGWMLAGADRAVLVSAACSATGYFLMVVALLGWRLARTPLHAPVAGVTAIVAALPVTIFVNALRVVALLQAHRWLIPRFPENYGPFLHLLTGVGVFLPALIGLNLILEFHGNSRRRSS